MSSPAVLDFAKLLAEIPAASNGQAPADPNAPPPSPAGVDLEADGVTPSLSAIRSARRAAREAEDAQAKQLPNAPVPNWRPVVEMGTLALAERSKHLDVAAYLIEALVRLHGFPGLRDGLRLTRELMEKYWEHVFPLPNNEGLKNRVDVLGQILLAAKYESLLTPLSKVSLVERPPGGGPLDLNAYQEAAKLNNPKLDLKIRAKRIEDGVWPPEKLREFANGSTPQFYIGLVADLTDCLAELAKLQAALDERCKGKMAREDEPGVSTLRNHLNECLDAVKDIARDLLPPPPAADQPAPTEGAPAAVRPAAAPADSGGPIQNRDDAFRVLGTVAEFFKKTEPHSVVSYALEQVVRWGRMPLPELLSELIPDDAPRKNLFQRVGIKGGEPPKPEKK